MEEKDIMFWGLLVNGLIFIVWVLSIVIQEYSYSKESKGE